MKRNAEKKKKNTYPEAGERGAGRVEAAVDVVEVDARAARRATAARAAATDYRRAACFRQAATLVYFIQHN